MDTKLPPLFWNDPRENAPSFVKGKVSVKAQEFIKYIKDNEEFISQKGWIDFDMLEAKSGSIYFKLNTFKPQTKEKKEITYEDLISMQEVTPDGKPYPMDENGAVKDIYDSKVDINDSIPF